LSTGKNYEIFVQHLQQALLNSEKLTDQKNIEIERNKKITDNCGIGREFDLYWEYELAGITYKTVIECKDYASRVSIDKIDALIGKIRDIPDLKPVFATKTGYQSGAEEKARFNRVDLLIVREQLDDDWEGYFREINVLMNIEPCSSITNFKPSIDGKWVETNSHLSLDSLQGLSIPGTNNEIFIEDVANNEQYSLYDLQYKLNAKSNGKYGNLSYIETFENAYFVHKHLRLKLTSFEVDYFRPTPIEVPINIDYSKELVGVIKYLHKGSTTAIFRDKVVKDWK
jgi:hypothetical protein